MRQASVPAMLEHEPDLATVIGQGDPEGVRALIAAGADIRYKREGGYDALLDAVHGRDVVRDPRLLALLELLVEEGVDLNGISDYKESGLRVLSHIGRFDAVRLLLSAGAPREHLQWTPLIEAVALGSLADVERLVKRGAALEETDWWERTAWLVALLAGDLDKAKLLRELGANVDARGRCGMPPLSYAIEGHHPSVLRWLLDIGQDVEQKDEFGGTPLICAVEAADLNCIEVLLGAGANVDYESKSGSVLHRAETREIARRLLDAGADPGQLSQEGHRALCGLGPVAEGLSGVSKEEFLRARTRTFGTANPDSMREPFWEAMLRTGVSGYQAAASFDAVSANAGSPVWSAMRFGQSITFLPDGRIVHIAGEHEDSYDPDFCIYNDVFVHGPDGSIAILGYPEAVFPPTDYHTATLVGDMIYIIGSLGYMGARRYGETPIHRLDVETFRMERLDATGEAPGWIYEHRAVRLGSGAIRVSGGKLVTAAGDGEAHTENLGVFLFDPARLIWRREH
jgi:ankyrin repeat protein